MSNQKTQGSKPTYACGVSQDINDSTRGGSSKKWYWEDCKSQLKTYNLYDLPQNQGANDNEQSRANGRQQPEDGNQVNASQNLNYFNLDPSIVLTNPLQNQEEEPEVQLTIDMERNFLLDEGSQWTWHKSWNLPNISITLDLKDPESQETLLPPPNLHAKIFAVKKENGDSNLLYQSDGILFDVGLKGNEEKILVNSYAIFSGLKFKTTSYNHEGAPFFLVISIYLGSINDSSNQANQEGNKQDADQQTQQQTTTDQPELPASQQPRVLMSKISPPLYINSRKLAKETSSKKYHTVIEPFDLQAVEQDLYIRSSKLHQSHLINPSIASSQPQVNEQKITSDIIGLINYFSAPNIRNKVRHPLFLALKFNQCVSIYYNPKKIGEPDQKSIAIRLHKDMQQEFSFGTLTNAQIQALQEAQKGVPGQPEEKDIPGVYNRNVKFICFINIQDTVGGAFQEQLILDEVREYVQEESKNFVKDGSSEVNYSEEYRKRLIENNFDLMNGITIQVTTDKNLIPKYFIQLDDMEELKAAVAQDMDGNNLNLLLNQTQKRKDKDEISKILQPNEEDSQFQQQQQQQQQQFMRQSQAAPYYYTQVQNDQYQKVDQIKRTLPGLNNNMIAMAPQPQQQQQQQQMPQMVYIQNVNQLQPQHPQGIQVIKKIEGIPQTQIITQQQQQQPQLLEQQPTIIAHNQSAFNIIQPNQQQLMNQQQQQATIYQNPQMNQRIVQVIPNQGGQYSYVPMQYAQQPNIMQNQLIGQPLTLQTLQQHQMPQMAQANIIHPQSQLGMLFNLQQQQQQQQQQQHQQQQQLQPRGPQNQYH